MIECYFRWCEHHCKDEPFCNLDNCVATKEQIIDFTDLRVCELKAMGHVINDGDEVL